MRYDAKRTDGSNGYTPGTWEARVHDEHGYVVSADGGWSSREDALARAKQLASVLRKGSLERLDGCVV